MKIVRVIARLNVGGPARHVTLLNAGLQARGHDTLLIHGALDTGEASLDAPAVASGIPMERHPHLGRRVSATSDIRAFLALLGAIVRARPDVVHTHTAKAGALGRVAALLYNLTRRRSRRALIVHTFHGHVFEGYFSPTMNRIVRVTERSLALASDRIVTISPRQQADIVERFAVAPAAKTVVVPLGLQLDALLELPALARMEGAPVADSNTGDLRSTIGAGAGDVVVGYAGRMVPVKDLPTLIDGFAKAASHEPRLRLMLAGDGPERAAAARLAETLGVTDRVCFVGWVKDLPRFYATVDIFALSSVNEGTPVAVIEAMAAARPVVATAVGGVPDVVAEGETGLLVPQGDADAFARALLRLAGSARLRSDMGAAGRTLASARYSHLRLVDDVERMYVEALAEKRGVAGNSAPCGGG